MAISVTQYEHLLRQFSSLDTDGNGKVTLQELRQGLQGIPTESIAKMISVADTDGDGSIDVKEYIEMMKQAMFSGTEGTGGNNQALVNASAETELQTMKLFSMMDNNGNGFVNQKELERHLYINNISLGKNRVEQLFNTIKNSRVAGVKDGRGFNFQDLLAYVASEKNKDEGDSLQDLKNAENLQEAIALAQGNNVKLTQADLIKLNNCQDCEFKSTLNELLNAKEVAEYQQEDSSSTYWAPFINFKRRVDRKTVMSGVKVIKDVLPGDYSLGSLVEFQDLPPIEPKHAVVKNCFWITGVNGKKGTVTFPQTFDGKIPIDIATSETVGYYGAYIAETMRNTAAANVYLGERHAIEDFTYAENYYEKWVMGDAGGPALEFHQFHHLDMPLSQDSGYWVLAKWGNTDETELHITAFQVPIRHTLYTPGGIIHTNNHLKGTWRTMLSDGPITEALMMRGRSSMGFQIVRE